jgi:hypothetical protein
MVYFGFNVEMLECCKVENQDQLTAYQHYKYKTIIGSDSLTFQLSNLSTKISTAPKRSC